MKSALANDTPNSSFIPLCLKNHINKLIKSRFKPFNLFPSSKEINTNASTKKIFLILKHWEKYLSETIKNGRVKSLQKIANVSNHCDVFEIKIQQTIPYIKIISMTCTYTIVRFYSYSRIFQLHYLIFNVTQSNNSQVLKGGIILRNQWISLYIKKSKKCSIRIDEKCLIEILIEYVRDLIDISRYDAVKTLSSGEEEIDQGMNSSPFDCHKMENNMADDDYYLNSEEDNEGEILNDHCQSFMFNTPGKEYDTVEDFGMEISQKFVGEEDENYKNIKMMTEDGLEQHGLSSQYQQLKNLLQLVYPEKEMFTTNEMIRYIYGWRGDVQSSFKAMKELHDWRISYKPENLICCDDMSFKLNYEEVLSIACQDIYGRPILLFKAKYLFPKNINSDSFVRYLVYLMETAIRKMPPNIDKIILIVDIKDAGTSNFSIGIINKIKESTNKYYVERMSNIFIINKGFWFGLIWKVISPFLEERVQKKMTVIDKNNIGALRKILGEKADFIL